MQIAWVQLQSGLPVAFTQKALKNPSYAAKAAEIGRIVQAENGVSAACDAIEKQL